MSREAFHQLIKRYLEGNCSEEEKRIVERWYGLLDNENIPEIDPAELPAADERLWRAIHAKINQAPAPAIRSIQPAKRRLWPSLAIAASLVGILVVVLGLLYQKAIPVFEPGQHTALMDTVNTTTQPIELTLADGSTVVLQPQASLTYPEAFAPDKREVFLTGEAFFSIEKDTSHPFYVHSQQLLVQVVGTSFWVRAPEQQAASEVTVVSGKVRVTEAKEPGVLPDLFTKKSEVLLTPNQRVVYAQESKELTVSLVEEPVIIVPEAGESDFIFNESPLMQVLEELEKTYGIPIRAADAGIYRCTFTGDLGNQDLYERLELICQSIGASYEIKGTTIVLYGGNCR